MVRRFFRRLLRKVVHAPDALRCRGSICPGIGDIDLPRQACDTEATYGPPTSKTMSKHPDDTDPSSGAIETPLAYQDDTFLDSDEGRPVRILSEYLGPLRAFRLAHVHDTIVFFGSARVRESDPLGVYYEHARQLAAAVTHWSKSISAAPCRLVVCSGGGGGIMEAANRGAMEAGGRTIGLNIGLPFEQRPNPYLSPDLTFEFHYFFMRKLWFAHLARAIVVFPGGFGTLDELFEILTLMQTRKIERGICIVLYGSSYWKEIINFEALVRHGVIREADLQLFRFADDPQTALRLLQENIPLGVATDAPAIAKSNTPCCSPSSQEACGSEQKT